MTRPRNQLISTEDTPYYHCISRCVRRAYLCGADQATGQSYEHRRQWVENRIRLLSTIFAIDICGYAVMSNHYHLVVKLGSTKHWSDRDVVRHWLTLYKGPILAQRFHRGQALNKAELETLTSVITTWRGRLQNLSWFMKCLNEHIARMANAEDQCTGHFWESRFKCQALLTDEALLTCMAYVDLNPVRAGLAATPEESAHTSIRERICPMFDLRAALNDQHLAQNFALPAKPLLPFEGILSSDPQNGILYSLRDYLQLLDWSGRCLRLDKRGRIDARLPEILLRLNIAVDDWLSNCRDFEKVIHRRFRKAG